MTSDIELLVCTTCRNPAARVEAEADAAAPRPGAALASELAHRLPDGIRIVPVQCLSNCSRGCTVALRGPGRWTYVYGDLNPAEHIGVIAEGVALYRDAPDGVVPWRQRPEHFRRNCIARIPPIEGSND